MELPGTDKVFIRVTDFGRLHIRTRCHETGKQGDVFLSNDQSSALAKFLTENMGLITERSNRALVCDPEFPDEELSDLALLLKYPGGL